MLGLVCKWFVGLTIWGRHAARAKQGLGLESSAKEFRVYPEGNAEALQDFKQRCGVIRFTI